MSETREQESHYVPTEDFGLTSEQRVARQTERPAETPPEDKKTSVPEQLPGVTRLAKAQAIERRHGPKHTTSHNTKLNEGEIAQEWDDRTKSNRELVDTAARSGDRDAQAAIDRYKGSHVRKEPTKK